MYSDVWKCVVMYGNVWWCMVTFWYIYIYTYTYIQLHTYYTYIDRYISHISNIYQQSIYVRRCMRCMTLPCLALILHRREVTLCSVALSYIALHGITLCWGALHYVTLQCIALNYIVDKMCTDKHHIQHTLDISWCMHKVGGRRVEDKYVCCSLSSQKAPVVLGNVGNHQLQCSLPSRQSWMSKLHAWSGHLSSLQTSMATFAAVQVWHWLPVAWPVPNKRTWNVVGREAKQQMNWRWPHHRLFWHIRPLPTPQPIGCAWPVTSRSAKQGLQPGKHSLWTHRNGGRIRNKQPSSIIFLGLPGYPRVINQTWQWKMDHS